ncbi:MAG: bifunctional DNA-formamidopyrimidine glycosylase/DNA-(apurinic or apyrimidinic site) lyase [Alphaproteobacteria bacterium]|nr:bifunctional DNA-formamidopyrimidine glycosylase/DNA-(apurinic or apyrimidinic site) lyase [Alphaproteobacteria bacterium]
MPELPEVETVRRGLIPVLEGKILRETEVYRDGLRYPFPPLFRERLKGRKILNLTRRAKYLLLNLDEGYTLVIHLGMSGRIRIEDTVSFMLQKHDHVVFYSNENKVIAYNDARRFGLMDLVQTAHLTDHPLFRHLGPEPFDDNLTPTVFYELLKKRQHSIKIALLDQKLIVGVGNIYASEALWGSGIHPFRSSHSLTLKDAENLLDHIRKVLQRAIMAGGSTLKDHQQPDGKLGYFQHQFAVYGRHLADCTTEGCAGKIKKEIQAGRSTFYCDACQK